MNIEKVIKGTLITILAGSYVGLISSLIAFGAITKSGEYEFKALLNKESSKLYEEYHKEAIKYAKFSWAMRTPSRVLGMEMQKPKILDELEN